jgi:hypothetical protein
MTSYAPIDSRSPRGMHSPLHSPSYAPSASGSSQGENASNPFLHSQGDHGVQRHMNGSGASSVGGREFGPYAPLNRRMNGSSSYDEDHRSLNSSAERLVGPEGAIQGAALTSGGAPGMVDMRGPEPDDYLVSWYASSIDTLNVSICFY